MIRGLYTAAAGMLAQQHRQDILTNNMANVNTPGYKSKHGAVTAFPEVLLNAVRLTGGKNQEIGRINQGVLIEETIPVFMQGDLTETGVSSHMAIWDKELAVDPEKGTKPALFFTLEDKDGNRLYTRSGLFTVDAAGQLVTPEGHLVLDDWNTPIQTNGQAFKLDDKGNIIFSDGEVYPARVGLTVITDLNQMTYEGNQIYSYNGQEDDLRYADPDEGDNYNLSQGKIERSNVDITQTMVDMMTALKIYEANQKVIQSIDRTLEKAVNEIGRV